MIHTVVENMLLLSESKQSELQSKEPSALLAPTRLFFNVNKGVGLWTDRLEKPKYLMTHKELDWHFSNAIGPMYELSTTIIISL